MRDAVLLVVVVAWFVGVSAYVRACATIADTGPAGAGGDSDRHDPDGVTTA